MSFFTSQHRLARWLPVVFYYGVIFFLSSFSRFSPAFDPLIHHDKIVHFVEFGILGALLARAVLWNDFYRILKIRWWLFGLLFSAFAAASDEFHQRSIPGREVDVLDWIADLTGALTGYIIYWRISFLVKKRKLV